MIPFFKPYGLQNSQKYIEDVITSGHLSGDGKYTLACSKWLKETLEVANVLMTSSCTSALELACSGLELEEGDEVIVPSFTYPSTANAVLQNNGRVVYCEVESKHLTMDPSRLEAHITPRTKAIIVVHYGGVSCDMKPIMALAKPNNLVVIEDAAQGFLGTYEGQALGTIGDMACFSFHGSKDIVAGEGGALIVNNKHYFDQLAIARLKGTNQEAFKNGLVPYYEWIAKGTSSSPSDLLMAVLYGQLELSHDIVSMKVQRFRRYQDYFEEKNYPQLKSFSTERTQCDPNGHLFYIEFVTSRMAKSFVEFMANKDIHAYTHFIPLHESVMGKNYVRSDNDFRIEKGLGQRLVRLPLYADLDLGDQMIVLSMVEEFMAVKV